MEGDVLGFFFLEGGERMERCAVRRALHLPVSFESPHWHACVREKVTSEGLQQKQ